jgi:PAS domain S-box-containing protein
MSAEDTLSQENPETGALSGDRGIVWIVDDSPLEAEMAKRAISPRYDVAVFADGAMMLERLASGVGPDALVLDWQLPGMSGIEVCRFLRGTLSQIALPIVMVTVHGHKQDIVDGLAAGANDYLTKPYDPPELLARVGALVRTRRLHERAQRAERSLEIERDRLLQSERRFSIVAEAIPQIVWSADERGTLDYFNQRWLDYTGVTLEQASGVGWQSLLHPDDQDRCLSQWARSVETGEIYDIQYRLRRGSDGAYHWFLGRALPLRDESGRISRWFGTFTDIDEHKRAELALDFLSRASIALTSSLDSKAASKSITQLTVPSLADWCGVYLREGSAAIKLAADARAGLDEAEHVSLLAVSYPLVPDASYGASKVLRTGSSDLVPDVADARHQARGGEAAHLEALREAGVTSWMMVPLSLQGRAFGCLAFAITTSNRRFDEVDLSLAEELGRRTAVAIDNARLFEMTQHERARVEEANHAKDEFLATVSHELRTPLNAILGWIVMLRGNALSEEKRARAITTIERNARSQAQLIEDLLDISRIISGKLRLNVSPIQPLGIIESALETVRPAADAKGVRLHPALDSHVGLILGDAERLQQVIWNLLSNAVKFTPKGGRVHVRLQRVESDAQISVADTGEGISADFLPHVFERFRQADMGISRSHGGLGLGLAITRHLVELHGGVIHATSPGEGLGTTVTVRLPLAPLHSTSAPSGDLTSELSPSPLTAMLTCPPELEGLRVLVVEDEHDARDLMTSVLEGCFAKVTAVANVADALDSVRRDPPDVLVSDVGMPGQSGYDLIRKIRGLPPDQGGRTPAIALTAYARMEDRTRALVMGFDMHIPKPIEPSELLVVIAHLASRFSKK